MIPQSLPVQPVPTPDFLAARGVATSAPQSHIKHADIDCSLFRRIVNSILTLLMRAHRFQSASACLLAATVALWLVIAPLLVICTCSVGHAAITTTSHVEAACGHEPCHAASASDEQPHDDAPTPHNDSDLTIDIAAPRAADVIALPAFDVVIALLQGFSIDAAVDVEFQRSYELHDTGPPRTIVCALAATILLI